MYSLRYYLPGVFVWLLALSFFLGIFLQYWGAGWGPPFYFGYFVMLGLFILSLFVPVPDQTQPIKGDEQDSGSGGNS